MSEQSTTERHLQTRDGAGHDADSPREIPAKGWWQISRRSLTGR